MTFGDYRINLDALLARIVYRWHWKIVLSGAGLILLLGLLSGLIPPIWKGAVTLEIHAPNDTSIEVDGRTWPYVLYAGNHQVVARHADGRVVWADVSLSAGDRRTLTLPPGLPEPRERILPPPAPGTAIAQVWWADGAWRVLSLPIPPATDEADSTTTAQATPLVSAGQTVAISSIGMERLTTLDAYAGLADQVHHNGRLIEAVFVQPAATSYSTPAPGVVEVRGWGQSTQAITLSSSLALVRFSPTGDVLLLAEQVTTGGEQVYLARPGIPRVPVVAVPGHISRLSWREDGTAVVLHSRQGERLTLTLVRFKPSITAVVIADVAASQHAGDLVPLSWDNTGLVWVAPDRENTSTLWHAAMTNLIPERIGQSDARALTHLPDGTLRAVVIQAGQVVIGQYQQGLFIGETTVPGVPAADDLAGIWQGDELLLQSGTSAWLLTLSNPE